MSSSFEQRLKVVLRSAMKSSGIGQSQLVHRWHQDEAYRYIQRNVVRDLVFRLLHPHYPIPLHHFEFALKLMDCDVQFVIVPRGNNEPKEQRNNHI